VMSIELLIATCALIAVIVLATVTLQGWQGWLALKRHELELAPGGRMTRTVEPEAGASREVAARIELADLRERVRKLEAIASGVDL
jgi:hypothetical protein